MSIFKKIKPVRLLGKAAKLAAPVLAATGVGIPLAIGVGAAGNVLDKGKRVTAGGLLKNAALTAGGGLAGKALGTTSLLGRLTGGAPVAGSPSEGIGDEFVGPLPPDAPGGIASLGHTLGTAGSGIWNWIKAHPERAANLGFGAVGAVQAAHRAGQANALQQQAIGNLNLGPWSDYGNPYATGQPPNRGGRAALLRELGR